MKTLSLTLLLIIGAGLLTSIYGQGCVSCNGTINSGLYSTAINYNTQALGEYSFAAGNGSVARLRESVAIGLNAFADGRKAFSIGENSYSIDQGYSFGLYAKATGTQSFAFGRGVESAAGGAMVIGTGIIEKPLVNRYSNSLMIGFNSSVPTLFVGTSPNSISSGNVGIGTSSPLANLHILSNTGENALLYLQTPGFKSKESASFFLGNKAHGMIADAVFGLVFKTEKNYLFNEGNVGIGTTLPQGKLHVVGKSLFDKVGIGTTNPLTDLQVNGSVSIGYDAAMPSESRSLIVSGNVGIGTFTPAAKLDVAGKVKVQNFQLATGFNTGYVLVSDYQGNASWADPTTVNAGAWLRNGNNVYVGSDRKIGIGTETPAEQLQVTGNILIGGAIKGGHADWRPLAFYGGTSESDGSYILMGNNSTSSDGSIKMFAKGTNSNIEFNNKNMTILALRANNEIVMGNPDTKVIMRVNGDITANLVRVNTQSWWDEVFDDTYTLQPLAEVEAYIAQHKHLPGIPSEAEVKANGIDIAQINALLLKKIEELTLYVIELEKKLNERKEKLE